MIVVEHQECIIAHRSLSHPGNLRHSEVEEPILPTESLSERTLARNTQRSDPDALALLIPFIAGKVRKPSDQLGLDHVSPTLTTER
jgi:hypothetical protein